MCLVVLFTDNEVSVPTGLNEFKDDRLINKIISDIRKNCLHLMSI